MQIQNLKREIMKTELIAFSTRYQIVLSNIRVAKGTQYKAFLKIMSITSGGEWEEAEGIE